MLLDRSLHLDRNRWQDLDQYHTASHLLWLYSSPAVMKFSWCHNPLVTRGFDVMVTMDSMVTLDVRVTFDVMATVLFGQSNQDLVLRHHHWGLLDLSALEYLKMASNWKFYYLNYPLPLLSSNLFWVLLFDSEKYAYFIKFNGKFSCEIKPNYCCELLLAM